MPNFALRFRLEFYDEVAEDAKPGDTFTRIVEAVDAESACCLGEGMIGEHIYEREALADLLSVEPTDQAVLPPNSMDAICLTVSR